MAEFADPASFAAAAAASPLTVGSGKVMVEQRCPHPRAYSGSKFGIVVCKGRWRLDSKSLLQEQK